MEGGKDRKGQGRTQAKSTKKKKAQNLKTHTQIKENPKHSSHQPSHWKKIFIYLGPNFHLLS